MPRVPTLQRIFALAFLVALSSCERCTLLSSAAESERKAGPHTATLKAQAHRAIGVGFAGAPHVGGIVWPTIEGHGYVVTVRVASRPEVTIAVASTEKQAGEEELQRVLVRARAIQPPLKIEGTPRPPRSRRGRSEGRSAADAQPGRPRGVLPQG
jgi:hypothetical protein